MSTERENLLDQWFDEPRAEYTPSEISRLTQSLRDDPMACRQLVESALLEVALRRVCAEQATTMRQRKKFWPLLAVAASVLILLTATAIYMAHRTLSDSTHFSAKTTSAPVLIDGHEQFNIPNGASLEIPSGPPVGLQLTDGSTITADAATRLAIFRDHPNTREFIQFTRGSASFNVSKDARDFIIHTDTADVRVVGTQFRIATWSSSGPLHDALRINVSEGRVSVKTVHGEETLEARSAGTNWSWARLTDGREGPIVSGHISTITLAPRPGTTLASRQVELDGKKNYSVSSRVSLTLNAQTCTLDQLQVGMTADIVLAPSGSEAYAILATSP